MTTRGRSLVLMLFAFIITLFILPKTAGAWSFVSDGAVPNGNGGWDWTQASVTNKHCLACHNPTTMPDSDKTSYLLTGHKNVLRRVGTGISAAYWVGSGGQIYQTDAFGRPINLLSGLITLTDGFTAPMYYIFADWMSSAPSPNVIYGTNGSDQGSGYACAKCHTTGYGAVTASSFVSYNSPNNSITVANTFLFNPMPSILASVPDPVLQTATQPDHSVSAQINYTGKQWVFDGITCTRCHDVTPHGGTDRIDFAPAPTNQNGTALCYNCHQEPPAQNVVDMAGNSVTPDNFYPALYLSVGYNGSYTPAFSGYSTTHEFFNSPHSRFSGTAGRNNDGLTNVGTITSPSYYASRFNDGVNNLGCTSACHDPHKSTVDAVKAATGTQPMRVTCQTCHTEIVLSTTAHPESPGTPFDTSLYGNSCEVCHMVRPDNGKADKLHLFRISVDANYTTFPTPSQFRAGQSLPNTADDGSSFPGKLSAWVDLDLACGQCHGGGGAQVNATGSIPLSTPTSLTVSNGTGFTEGQRIMIAGAGAGGTDLYSYAAAVSGSIITLTDAAAVAVSNANVIQNPTQSYAPYKPRTELAADANNIHRTFASPNFIWVQVGNSNTVNFDASSTVCPSGGTCTYSWNFGDATTDNSNRVTLSHSYSTAAAGVNSYTATLTVVNTSSAVLRPETRTETVTVNIPPTVNEASVSANNMTVTLVDASTAGSSVSVAWGDGSSPSTGSAGGTFTHTYAVANTYTIVHTAKLQGLTATKNIPITVPTKYTVSGLVTSKAGTPLSSVSLSLKLGGVTKGITSTDTNGNYTFINVVPGTYTITASKSGYTFANPAASVTVTGGNVTGVNFSSTN